MENPAEMEKLEGNLDELMPTFIDETIRWVTPVRHFMRTATQDYTLRDTQIKRASRSFFGTRQLIETRRSLTIPFTSRWTEMMQNRLPLDLEHMFVLDSISPEWRCLSCLKSYYPGLSKLNSLRAKIHASNLCRRIKKVY